MYINGLHDIARSTVPTALKGVAMAGASRSTANRQALDVATMQKRESVEIVPREQCLLIFVLLLAIVDQASKQASGLIDYKIVSRSSRYWTAARLLWN